MKTKVFILSLSLISLMLISFNAVSQEHLQKERACNENSFMNSLNEDLQTQIIAIRIESKQKIALSKADLKIKEGELDKILLEEKPSKVKVNAKVDEIQSVKGDIQKERLTREIDVKSLLTPEQQLEYNMHNKHEKHNRNLKSSHKKGENRSAHQNCDHN